MVMGKRPEVPTAGPIATVRALLEMLLAIVRSVVSGLGRKPWRGAPDPGRAVAHDLMLNSMKGFCLYRGVASRSTR
jgi:hypothetical protein